MKLICSPISPYARKVMMLARLSEIPLEEVEPTKDGSNGYVAGHNPLGKIPALEWQPGQFLFDSPVICEYLDSLRDTPLLPVEGHERFIQLWQHALGDGLSDAVYNHRVETFRPEALHWPQMIERHNQAIDNALATLENISNWLGSSWSYGNIAIVCGLDYASYRAGHIYWQEDYPKLMKWYESITDHDIWRETYAYEMTSS